MISPEMISKAENALSTIVLSTADQVHGLARSLEMSMCSEFFRNSYTPVWFKPQEFVPPATYELLKENSLIVMDSRILWTMDAIRAHFGKPVIINNYLSGGDLTERGYRTENTLTGKIYSQHKFGRACDFDVEGMTSDDVRHEIITNPYEPAFRYITAIELNTSWVHIDVRQTIHDELLLFAK